MNRIIVAIVFLFCLSASAQINQGKLDSLTRHMESERKVTAAYQDSFIKRQDSLYKAGLNRAISQNTPLSATPLVLEESTQIAKRKNFIVMEIALVVLSIIAIAVIKFRKKKA